MDNESRREIDAFKEAYKRDPDGTMRDIERKIAEARMKLVRNNMPIITIEDK
jgi:hypothetical protein